MRRVADEDSKREEKKTCKLARLSIGKIFNYQGVLAKKAAGDRIVPKPPKPQIEKGSRT